MMEGKGLNLLTKSCFCEHCSWLSLFRSYVIPRADIPTCYYPSKLVAIEDYACNRSSEISSCCAVDWTCLDNGLCRKHLRRGTTDVRGSCTDPAFLTSACPSYCSGISDPLFFDRSMKCKLMNQADDPKGGSFLISCQNVTGSDLDVCCNGKYDCCNSGVGRIRLRSRGKPVRVITPDDRMPVSMATSVHSSASPMSTSLQSSPSLPSSPTSSTISQGAKVGIGVGATISAISLIALVFFLWYRRKRARASKNSSSIEQDAYVVRKGLHEMPNNSACVRLNASEMIAELPWEWKFELQAKETTHEMPGITTQMHLSLEKHKSGTCTGTKDNVGFTRNGG